MIWLRDKVLGCMKQNKVQVNVKLLRIYLVMVRIFLIIEKGVFNLNVEFLIKMIRQEFLQNVLQ